MNRRNFLGSLVKAFTILPAATTYTRRWTTLGSLVVPEYTCVMQPLDQRIDLYSSKWVFFDVPTFLAKRYIELRIAQGKIKLA